MAVVGLRPAPALRAAVAALPVAQGTGKLASVELADWTTPTIDSWRHSIWVGVWDPWIVVFKVWQRVASQGWGRWLGRAARAAGLGPDTCGRAPFLPSPPVQGPVVWYKVMREIVTLERMHRAFDDGLMEVRRRGGVLADGQGQARACVADVAGPAADPCIAACPVLAPQYGMMKAKKAAT